MFPVRPSAPVITQKMTQSLWRAHMQMIAHEPAARLEREAWLVMRLRVQRGFLLFTELYGYCCPGGSILLPKTFMSRRNPAPRDTVSPS